MPIVPSARIRRHSAPATPRLAQSAPRSSAAISAAVAVQRQKASAIGGNQSAVARATSMLVANMPGAASIMA